MKALRTARLFAIYLLAAGCGGADDGPGIPVQDSELVAAGEQLFVASCSQCHGPDARGTERGPSFLSEVYVPSHHGDGAFLLAVQNGSRAHHWNFGDMPPVPDLSAESVEAIVAYVREQQRVEGFEPYPP